MAFILALGFQLKHKTTCYGGEYLTRHSHYVRVRLGGVPIWRLQCTRCKAVFTVLPHCVLRYRQMRPDVARDALLATHGGLSLELCAVICHISPMALYRLVCALGQQSLVTVLTRCGLPLPTYFLADEKHSRCLMEKVYLPTIVCGRVIWHLGYTEEASAAALTQSYGAFQRAAGQQDPSYRVRGVLTDGFDSCGPQKSTFSMSPMASKPRQNIVYLSAELNRLCRIRVSTYISIRDLSPVGDLILPVYSVVAHRNDISRVQSIYFRTSVKDLLARFVASYPV